MMWALLTTTRAGRAVIKVLIVLAVIGLSFTAFELWLRSHDKAVLEGYVKESELTATKALLLEAQRQRNAAALALTDYQKRATADQQTLKVANENLESIIAADTGPDGCTWSLADIDWLRKHGSKTAP